MPATFYLLIKVKIATPRARSPMMMAGIARPKADKPYKRKNRIKHQVAIELGILIFILLWENHKRLHEPVMKKNTKASCPLRYS